jgi:small nuclear ribonucleoprotein (snRNP)-like protein
LSLNQQSDLAEDVMKILMPLLLMLALIVSPVPRAALAQTGPGVTRIKTDIARRLRDAKTNVTVRLRNGSELKGRITQAAENVFTLRERNTGSQRDISYGDVTKVSGRGLSRGAKFGILTGIIAGAVIIGALVSLKKFDPFENGVLR